MKPMLIASFWLLSASVRRNAVTLRGPFVSITICASSTKFGLFPCISVPALTIFFAPERNARKSPPGATPSEKSSMGCQSCSPRRATALPFSILICAAILGSRTLPPRKCQVDYQKYKCGQAGYNQQVYESATRGKRASKGGYKSLAPSASYQKY